MNWNDFKCGRGQANERGDGARFNGECGDCRHNVEKYVAGLESKLDTIRDDTIRECWGAITAHIQLGQLQGNGCDDTAQRNGMILATNILSQKLEPKP